MLGVGKRGNFLSLFLVFSIMARSAVGRSVLMIWEARVCVVLLGRRRGRRPGARWRRSATSGSPAAAAAAGGAGHHLQGRHV